MTTQLSADGVRLAEGKDPIDMTFRSGEIVGLAGLDGHGQDAFLSILAGLRQPATGAVTMAGRPVGSLSAAVAAGIAYLPRDRRATGLFPTLSILDNFAIATLKRDTRLGFIARRAQRRRYEHYRDALSIVAPEPSKPITALSGGNQQKVLLARALALEPSVLLLNDPTRGVDVATRRVLYDVFKGLAAQGMGLVVLSSEIEEVLTLCERIVIFREFEVSRELTGSDRTGDAVLAAMFGQDAVR